MVGDHLQDRDRTVELLGNAFEEFDGTTGQTGVGLDHVEDAPRGVVFDRQHLLSAVIAVPVQMDRHRRMLAFEAHPRPFAALLGWILAHLIVLLKNFMDAVIGDREFVSDPEYVCDDDCASTEALAEVKYAVFEITGIFGVGSASWRLQLWNLIGLTVRFSELLDPPPTDLELFSNQPSIHAVVNNSLA